MLLPNQRKTSSLVREIGLVSLGMLLTLTVVANAQKPSASPAIPVEQSSVKTFQLDSKLLGRRIPYGVVLPTNYDFNKQERFPVVYLLHGLSGSYKTFADNQERLEDFPKRRAIFVLVEGGTGWFTDSATVPNDKYESYVIRELIPEIDNNLRTIAERKGRAIAGVSMGGYGAIKYGVKYPQMFALAGSWSGVANAASWRKVSELPPSPRIVKAVTAVFGDGSEPSTLLSNDLFKLFADIPSDKVANLPFFYLDCGTEDELLKPNQQLAELFVTRKIRHEYRQIPGGHGLQDYRVVDVLNLYERLLAP
jgi:putative tributyrin esterase